MGVEHGKNALHQSYKELAQRWDRVTEQWDDAVSRDFHSQFIAPVEPRLRATMEAMDDMAELLRKVRRECQ